MPLGNFFPGMGQMGMSIGNFHPMGHMGMPMGNFHPMGQMSMPLPSFGPANATLPLPTHSEQEYDPARPGYDEGAPSASPPVAVVSLRRRDAAGIKATPTSRSTKTLWLSRVPESADVAALSSFFSQFGDILNVQVIPEKAKAFIAFVSPESAAVALNSRQAILGDPQIRVAMAHYDNPKFEKGYARDTSVRPVAEPPLDVATIEGLKKGEARLTELVQHRDGIIGQISKQNELKEKVKNQPKLSAEDKITMATTLNSKIGTHYSMV